MKWFDGGIPAAIQESKARKAVFIVYIKGDDSLSEEMNKVWEDDAVNTMLESYNCVGLQIEAKSEACGHFSLIYPVMTVPVTYFIGENGVPLEVTAGHVEPAKFVEIIQKTEKMHQDQLAGRPLPAAPSGSSTAQQEGDVASASTAESSEDLDDRVERAKKLVAMKQAEKAQEEAEKLKKQELERRKVGSEMAKLKQWQQEQDVKEMKDQLRKEKEEDRKARERIKEQIAQDRADRAAKFQQEKKEQEQAKVEKLAAQERAKKDVEDKDAATRRQSARLQFRMPDGSSITHTFPSSEPLQTAHRYLQEQVGNAYGAFTLCTQYPKRTLTSADMSKTLLELELAPSAALIVLPGSKIMSTAPGDGGSGSMMWTLLAPFLAIWNFLMTFLFGSGNQQPPAQEPQASRPASEPTPQEPESYSASLRHTVRPNRPKSSYGVRRRQDGNIQRLVADDDDDDMTVYNGNSTQQM